MKRLNVVLIEAGQMLQGTFPAEKTYIMREPYFRALEHKVRIPLEEVTELTYNGSVHFAVPARLIERFLED